MRSVISISDLDKTTILKILTLAKEFKSGLKKDSLKGRVVASCFFEASTRTRLSFESAINYLGGRVIGFADSGATSLTNKGESLKDTFKIINCYADLLVMRHPKDGVARFASEVMDIPVINAGDGGNQHPTQTLLDLFSINDTQGRLDGVNLGLMGDLKYSRTVHSLISAAKLFNMRLFFIASPELRISHENLLELKHYGINYSFHDDLKDIMGELDCLYLTRLQKERFSEEINCNYGISLKDLEAARKNLKILHPLPRLSEIPVEIDDTPYAYYFEQAKNGVYVREAVLDLILGA